MICIFEGTDASGKDYIRAAFEQETDYANTVVTRFFFSQLVFARYFNRPLWENMKARKKYVLQVQKFIRDFKPLVIYCYADSSVLDDRIKKRGELPEKQPIASTIKFLYDEVFDTLGIGNRILRLDTSNDPPMETLVDKIKAKVKTMEKK